jgi:hypothetical protein
LNKDKKFPAKGAKKSKSPPAHEANLMDIDPPDDPPINDIELSGDECIVLECILSVSREECKQDGELDLSSLSPVVVRKSRNTFATFSAAKAKIALSHQTGTSFDSIQDLSALKNPSHIILMKSHSLLNTSKL